MVEAARLKRFFIFVCIALGAIPGLCRAQQCEALKDTDFSGIVDAPTRITGSTLVQGSGDVSEHCQVAGYVAPQVGFLLHLPTRGWNGKYLQQGCGGFCGTITGPNAATGDFSMCMNILRRGYACLLSDGGHTGSGGLWAYNDLQAIIDHAYRGVHVAALAGKAIVERFYGKTPKQSYFWGCSTGGRQALMEAQRFPWDFDGIIAGCPSIQGVHPALLWGHRAIKDESGQWIFEEADLQTLHEAVIAKCDWNDGVQDGLIGDPGYCDFDPATLACRDGNRSDCLTTAQIEAAQKIYAGPTNSRGAPVYTPVALYGSEKTWLGWFKDGARFAAEKFRYSAFYPSPGPGWKPEDFDFDRDYQRLGVMEALYAPVNPDLRKFKAAGGKLIAFAGWTDVLPLVTVDYYETVERTTGGRAATQDFFRLFAIPGMNHCSGGDGAFAVDWLSHLEAWVEEGKAPDRLLSFHVRLNNPADFVQAGRLTFPLDPKRVEFSRPVYPHPVQARYLGRGNPNVAESFGPVTP